MPSWRTRAKNTTTITTTHNAPHGQRHSTAIGEGDALYLSRSDIQYSIDAFRAVLRTATVYREQLEKTSQDASNFALALEQLARTDLGNEGVGAGLQACAGFHNLISNQNQVLGDALRKTFERPLEEHCRDYEAKLKSDEMEYEQTVAVLGESIRRTEARSFDLGRRGERDLNTFRSAIVDLTRQVDDLESVKAAYYQGVRDTRNLSLGLVMQTVGAVVRAEVDVYDKIAHKGITDPILEGMISSVPDPFESYSTSSPSEIYSILPPLHSEGYPALETDYLGRDRSYDAVQQNINRIDEESTGETPHQGVDHDDGERRHSEFSHGGDSYKHDTGTVNAFAALFGATITEVWAGQEDDEDDDDEDYEGNKDYTGDEGDNDNEDEEGYKSNEGYPDKDIEEEEDYKGTEGYKDDKDNGDGEGFKENEGCEGERGDIDDEDDTGNDEADGDKEDENDQVDEDGIGNEGYKVDNDHKNDVDDEDDDEGEVDQRDQNAGDGNGRRNSSEVLDEALLGTSV